MRAGWRGEFVEFGADGQRMGFYRCVRCGVELADDEARRRGFGRECYRTLAANHVMREKLRGAALRVDEADFGRWRTFRAVLDAAREDCPPVQLEFPR